MSKGVLCEVAFALSWHNLFATPDVRNPDPMSSVSQRCVDLNLLPVTSWALRVQELPVLQLR